MKNIYKLLLIYTFLIGIATGCALLMLAPSLNTVNMVKTK
jgi:hypothetical protein